MLIGKRISTYYYQRLPVGIKYEHTQKMPKQQNKVVTSPNNFVQFHVRSSKVMSGTDYFEPLTHM